MATCSKCNGTNEDDNYRYCLDCRLRQRDYNTRHKFKNLEHWHSYRKEYYIQHCERLKQYWRDYYKAHPFLESSTERKRKWCENNPIRAKLIAHNRRARKKGNGGTYTVEELNKLFDTQKGRCYLCGELLYASFDREVHIEHKIPISRGGTNYISNIGLAHSDCNLKKGIRTPEEVIVKSQHI